MYYYRVNISANDKGADKNVRYKGAEKQTPSFCFQDSVIIERK